MNMDAESQGKSNAKVNEQIQKFLHLMTASQNRIYGFILSLVLQSADADDIMQETTILMWEKFDVFEEGTDFVAWGIKIARYRILNFREKQKKGTLYLSDEAIQAIEAKSAQVMKEIDHRYNALKHCVKKLSNHDRLLLYLRYDQEVPVKAIADRVGKNYKTVYKLLARIHDVLWRCVRRRLVAEGGLL